jgi:hypothetical protein
VTDVTAVITVTAVISTVTAVTAADTMRHGSAGAPLAVAAVITVTRRAVTAAAARAQSRQPASCADPSSMKSLSYAERADTSTGTLRQHPGILGAFSNCCPRCVLRALSRLLLVFPGEIMKFNSV